MDDLRGRTAVITGAASGIGRGTALALAARGVRVVVADLDERGAAGVVEEITAAGGSAAALRADVTETTAFEALRDFALSRFGRIDIVMNNVGGLTRGRPEDLPLEEWARVLDLNLMSMVRSNAVFLPLLIAQGHGHIVNTASFSGLWAYAFDRLPYAAAKAAVIQLSEGLALYLRPQGIGVTCLVPGPVRTNIQGSARTFSEGLEARGPGPMFRVLEPFDVGEMVVEAILSNTFFLPTHPEVFGLLAERAADPDAFLQKQIDHPHFLQTRR